MKSDPAIERKCVHLKLRRGIHLELRRILLPKGLSLQEVFNQFAEEVAMGKPSALNVIERTGAEKIRRQIGPLEKKQQKRSNKNREFDHAALEGDAENLYALISEGRFDDDDDDDESEQEREA